MSDAREITRIESCNGLRPSVYCGLEHHVVVGIPQPWAPQEMGLDRFGDGCRHVENDLRLGTGRLQTVDRASNPLYYALIEAFCRLTGVPMVLNTSFNENEPVVCRPEEALDCFLRTKMDVLVLGQPHSQACLTLDSSYFSSGIRRNTDLIHA